MPLRILDVGQCHLDGPRMEALWRKTLDATVDRCDTARDALQRVARTDYDLVLVNRILDADGSSGLDLIRDLLKAGASAPVMLVSDRSDAQNAAVALGAVPGFGKAALNDPATVELVKAAASGDARDARP